MPGAGPGYFTGEAPDVGALSYGEPMPQVPRKPEAIPGLIPAGFWPLASNAPDPLKH
ncbi:MAG: hypothetical protein HC898_02250 [Phycisphaerales bacterium]|nr:hypothetical protein [Phycisphaerales bacterium]